LTATTPNEWKRRASLELPLGDMPLRTVKTILHEIAKELGSSSLDCLAGAGLKDPVKSVVYQYLKQMIKS
jgi:cytoskeleton-associated protein 5